MYGYTSANFSGRMPCNTMADAIVGTARSMTEKAIFKIQELFGLETVYGDTDSVFVDMKLDLDRRLAKIFEIIVFLISGLFCTKFCLVILEMQYLSLLRWQKKLLQLFLHRSI